MATFIVALVSVVVSLGYSSVVEALSLKIAPLEYTTTLQAGEVQKGYVDVSNPETQTVRVKLEAQAFRQIDDEGSLEFYSDDKISAGIRLDYDEITLGAGEAMRVYFLLDGAKLPEGDVFGAIMASTIPSAQTGSAHAVRVGTLIMVQNSTPVTHQAEITGLTASWLQIGDALQASFKVKNPETSQQATGFFPLINVATWPYGETTVQGPLVFAGRQRTIEYRQPGNFFGPIRLDVRHEVNTQSQWIFAITGYWRWLAPVILFFVTVVVGWIFVRAFSRR